MLKFVVYIILSALLLYIIMFVCMFIVAVAKYNSGSLTKEDLNMATWEYQKRRARKKAKKEAKKTSKRITSTSGQLHIPPFKN